MRTRYGPSLIQVAGETSLRGRHVLEASGGCAVADSGVFSVGQQPWK